MPAWAQWTGLGLLAWFMVSGYLVLLAGKVNRLRVSEEGSTGSRRAARDLESPAQPVPEQAVEGAGRRAEGPSGEEFGGAEAAVDGVLHRTSAEPLRILVVDDDPGLRALLRTSFEVVDIEVYEADSVASASSVIASQRPDAVVLDVNMPGVDGLTFCRGLKADPITRGIPVVLLTGADPATEADGRAAGADAFLRKPFSPLALLGTVERLAVGEDGSPRSKGLRTPDEQLLLYAQDFRRLVELERGQRALLKKAYRETVTALARALESKDVGTGAHSERVRRYATELTQTIDPALLNEPSLEYGFILHDVGKIGIPDGVLGKRGPLTPSEKRLIETHTVLGEQMVGDAALLRGEGVRVVRSHHERWDGNGYPDGLHGDSIPLGARIFTVADSLDAMTSDRPYRPAGKWEDAAEEIISKAGTQFDPMVVEAFAEREDALRRIYYELSTN